MRIWRQIASDSKTWSKENMKVSKSTHRDGASWRRKKCRLQLCKPRVVGERIELGIRREKLAQVGSNMVFAKKLTLEKKKGKANVVLIEPVFPPGKGVAPSYLTQFHIGAESTAAHASSPLVPYVPPYKPRADTGVATTPRPAHQGTRRLPRTVTSIPMTYTELLPRLLEQKLMEIVPLKPLVTPYPRSYDPNARCDYHNGVVGHATERCWSLKHKVQDLLDGGLLDFQDQGLNV
ncbi:hypothetical protein CR513_19389, partial [Mucuna pruriens]